MRVLGFKILTSDTVSLRIFKGIILVFIELYLVSLQFARAKCIAVYSECGTMLTGEYVSSVQLFV